MSCLQATLSKLVKGVRERKVSVLREDVHEVGPVGVLNSYAGIALIRHHDAPDVCQLLSGSQSILVCGASEVVFIVNGLSCSTCLSKTVCDSGIEASMRSLIQSDSFGKSDQGQGHEK